MVFDINERVYDRFENGQTPVPAGLETEISALHLLWRHRTRAAVARIRMEAPSIIQQARCRGPHRRLDRAAPMPSTLEHIREELGISQVDLAKLLNVGHRTYQRWEHGEFAAEPEKYEDLQALHAYWMEEAERVRLEILENADGLLADVRRRNAEMGFGRKPRATGDAA
jgi:transcriptional regulator with XRE-family HTH domain